MDKLQIFNNPEFGQIRMVEINEKPYAVGNDVAGMLEYARPYEAVSAHCKGAVTYRIPTEGGMQDLKVIPEGDIYRLIVKAADQSKNPEIKERAERIESWIFDEVLPEIRKTGAYVTNQANPEMLRKKADEIESLSTLNEAAKIILPILEEAGLKPQYRALALRQIYRKGGLDLPIEELKAEKAIFDLTTIAKAVGLYSAAGKPHGQAVGAIVSRLDIFPDEKEIVTFERNGHSGTANQYTKSVIEKVDCWIKNQGYPSEIPFTDSKGNNRTFSLKYSPSEKM
ncbi:MAG: BRO family protein [Eubacteriales bacterium]|jgi:prophage antirepressor-like protein